MSRLHVLPRQLQSCRCRSMVNFPVPGKPLSTTTFPWAEPVVLEVCGWFIMMYIESDGELFVSFEAPCIK